MGDFIETDEFAVDAAALRDLALGAVDLGWRLVPSTLFDERGEVRLFDDVLGARFERGEDVVGVHVYGGATGQLTLPVEDSDARRAFLAMAEAALGVPLGPVGPPR